MRIELWSDLICPWCGLGEHRLGRALAAFAHRDAVELVHRSFELDEGAPVDRTEPVREMLARKTGRTGAQLAAMTRQVEELARADGLAPYIVGDNQVGNTARAHQLAAWATDQGKGAEAWAALYRRYFGQARSIFAIDDLVEVARELGLDAEAARDVLAHDRLLERVRADGRAARELGARGVPFLVIEGRWAVAGAQATEAFAAALAQAWDETHPDARGDGVGVCTPDGCDPA